MVTAAWILASYLAMLQGFVALECLVGLGGGEHEREGDAADTAPPFTVLIPAHDEAAGLGDVLATVGQQIRSTDYVLVVADNCCDATARIALDGGARVCVRHDPEHVGKGYALAFGRETLRQDPRPVVIVLDADCWPAQRALQRLAAAASTQGAAVQGRYVLAPPLRASALVAISTFAFFVKNCLRQRALSRLGAPALLQGSGMALPWAMFDAAPLATAELAEDQKLGLDFVLAGERVRYDDRARFTSPAASLAATRQQRTRWEHGSLALAATYVPRLLGKALVGRLSPLPLALDLCVPPLAMLLAWVASAAMALAIVAAVLGSTGPLVLLAAATAAFGLALAMAWHRHGRLLLPMAALLQLPAYLLWKQPIYARLIRGRERRWVRTSRAAEP